MIGCGRNSRHTPIVVRTVVFPVPGSRPRMWRCVASAWLALMWCGLPAAWSQNAEVRPRWEVIAECQMVALPEKLALPLIPDLRDETRIDVAFATLQQMMTRGEATLVANLLARGAGDATLTAESVEEYRYPASFAPPQVREEQPPEELKELADRGAEPDVF